MSNSISYCFSNQNHDPIFQVKEQCFLCLTQRIINVDEPLVKRKYIIEIFCNELKGNSSQHICQIIKFEKNVFQNLTTSLIHVITEFKDLDHYNLLLIETIIKLLVIIGEKEFNIKTIFDVSQIIMSDKISSEKPYFILLGQILKEMEDTAQYIIECEDFINYLLVCINEENIEIKAIITFIFFNILSSQATLNFDSRKFLAAKTVVTLSSINDTHLMNNLLDLLQLLLKDYDIIHFLFELNCNDNEPNTEKGQGQIISLLFKNLLLKSDESICINTIGCICMILQSHISLKFSEAILKADLVEIIFMALNTCNVEYIIKLYEVLNLLNNNSTFYSNHHILYGFESILRNMDYLLKNGNYTLLFYAYNFIIEVFIKYSSKIKLFRSSDNYIYCLNLIKATLLQKEPMELVLAATKAFVYITKKEKSTDCEYAGIQLLGVQG